jgi:two-component system KDP operon response regulator KdpE
MPKVDGREVCRRVRSWSQIPIIILSALGTTSDKVNCLDLGADDYITKPFAIDELLGRIRAVLRRNEENSLVVTQPSIKVGILGFDFNRRLVTSGDNVIQLTATEYNLLQELVRNAGKVLTYELILRSVWGADYLQEKEYVRVYIRRLRAKLEPTPKNPEYILTIPRIGYRFKQLK